MATTLHTNVEWEEAALPRMLSKDDCPSTRFRH
jgi:hypothetical protein